MRVPRFVIAVVYSLSERSFRKSFSLLYTVVVNCAFQESPEVFLTHSALPPARWLFACIWRRNMDIFLQGHTERNMYLSLPSTRRVRDLARVFIVGDTAVRSSYLYFLIWYARTIRYVFASRTSFSLQSITFDWSSPAHLLGPTHAHANRL